MLLSKWGLHFCTVKPDSNTSSLHQSVRRRCCLYTEISLLVFSVRCDCRIAKPLGAGIKELFCDRWEEVLMSRAALQLDEIKHCDFSERFGSINGTVANKRILLRLWRLLRSGSRIDSWRGALCLGLWVVIHSCSLRDSEEASIKPWVIITHTCKYKHEK